MDQTWMTEGLHGYLADNEERNRLRLQAWEQRNQETSRAREQTALNVHLFGQPYKTIKGDELSNRIQRMLGSYEDNTSAEPFSVPSSLAFPLSNLVHAKSEPPQSLKGPCANPPSTHASPKHHCEAESQSSNQSSQPIRSTLQKTSPNDLNERQFSTLDRLQSYTTNHVNIQVSSKDPSSPLNRTIGMLHSQAFHPPLPYKQPNAAMTQKPTAYVRPMDGLDQVASESPELKPSPEHNTSLPDVALDKPAQGKGDLLPQFLETKTTVVQYVEDILKEMTCSWPPLLSGIHSPHPDVKPKPQCSVKEIDPPKQDNNQASSTDHSHPHHSSSVLSLSSAVDSVCPSDTESMKFETEMELENGTDDPPMSSALKSEPAHVSVASGDWQLEKFIKLKQRDYRSKSQWGIAQSPKLKDGLQQPTVSVLSPARDTSNPLSLDQKTVNFTTSQKSCPSAQESAEASDAVKPNQTKNDRNGGVTVHFEWTSSTQEEESRVKDGKMEKNCHKQSRKRSVVFENESTKSHHKDKDKVWPEVSMAQHDQCTSSVKSTFYSDHASPPRSRSKPKTEARRKKDSKLPQKDKRINGYSLDGSKDTLSLVVKIDLNLLSKIPRTSRSLENDTAQKDNKPHKEVSKSRKNDKEDESCPKKKQKLQEHNPLLHTTGHENSAPSDATEKRGKKKDQNLNLSSHKSKKNKQDSVDAPQLNQFNKEPAKSQKNPKKSSGKNTDESAVEKPSKESYLLEDRHYPVKHYIKEAKRLKHKADAETDKLRKSFHYLDAALFFIESGIAMERDPQISMSSYTMFAETVELIKFVLKLTNSKDPSAAENDLTALCLRCQALLQMAMFHHKRKTALTYSKTLIDHFNNSCQSAPHPSASIKGKPTLASPSSTPHGSAVIPQDIGRVALTYVNITTLYLEAHDLWEQADEFVKKGGGLSAELDKGVGRLSLASTMSSMVCYIRRGLHCLQRNSPKESVDVQE